MSVDTELQDDTFEVAFAAASDESVIEGADDTPDKDVIDKPDDTQELDDTSAVDDEQEETLDETDEIEETEETDDAAAKAEAEKAAAEVAEKAAASALAATKAAQTKPDPEAERAAKQAADDARAETERQATEAAAKEQLTEEEQANLETVKVDYPEVVKAMESYKRTLHAQFENKLEAKVKELSDKFQQQLAPVASVAHQYARNSHEAAILSKHADAFTELPKVEKWIEDQPKFLREAYDKVLDNGSTEAVIELLDTYKRVTAPTASAEPSAEEKAADAAKKKEKERKLAAQEGVRGRQAQSTGGIDESDFESAFEVAAGRKTK